MDIVSQKDVNFRSQLALGRFDGCFRLESMAELQHWSDLGLAELAENRQAELAKKTTVASGLWDVVWKRERPLQLCALVLFFACVKENMLQVTCQTYDDLINIMSVPSC